MTTCTPCEFAAEEGWWGDTLPNMNATHCDECHVSFPGAQVWGHCIACHNTFRGVETFDRHRELGNCPPVDRLTAKWVVAGRPVQRLHHHWGFDYYGTRESK